MLLVVLALMTTAVELQQWQQLQQSKLEAAPAVRKVQ